MSNNLNIYDRQSRTYGKDSIHSLLNSNVAIMGLKGGLATEVCKNLLLSGVRNLMIIYYPDQIVDFKDIESGFYYEEKDIGKECHIVLKEKLYDLNPDVNIEIKSIHDLIWGNLTTFIQCGHNINLAIKNNQLCRKNNTKFIWIKSNGFSGAVFVDVLVNHFYSNASGENHEPLEVDDITPEGKVTLASGFSHEYQTGDTIKFTNIVGDNLDIDKEWKINVINQKEFMLNDFDLKDFVFKNATCNYIDNGNHISSYPLQFEDLNIEGINQEEDQKIINIYKDDPNIPDDCWSEEMDKKVEKYGKIFRSFNLELTSVNSIIGSYGAMEVIKLITHKFTPVSQWLVYQNNSLIPDSPPTNIQPYGIGNLLGKEFIDKIENSNWLMVGCGAIGCEMLKNLAKMNLSIKGNFIVTDPDHIEDSNLSRQFLFRKHHVKHSKSDVACKAVEKMNPDLKLTPWQEKMTPDNKHLLDNVMPKITGVINALDNIQAREYMDTKCLSFQKPLFESGTKGMKGNTQPVIPFVTETYNDSVDPPDEKDFPLCTIKNFPNQIVHTIHWARDKFEFFNRLPDNLTKYKQNPHFVEEIDQGEANAIKQEIKQYFNYQPKNWTDCFVWASNLYLKFYRDDIIQLLHSFPPDHKTDNGEPFWTKGKRCPTPAEYQPENKSLIDFLDSTTHLMCRSFGINDNFTRNNVYKLALKFKPYKFKPENKKMAKNDDELKSEKQEQVELNYNYKCYNNFNPQLFEKDDDDNYHIEFIKSASNLRAINYGITPIDFYETKGIAGRIIPAVATTTSVVAGLISIEIMKYLYYGEDEKYIDKYQSWFVNMASNLIIPTEPMPASKSKFGDLEINKWQQFKYDQDMKLEQLLNHLNKTFDDEIIMIIFGSTILYSEFDSPDISKNLSTIFKEMYNIDLFNDRIELTICGEKNDELPNISLEFNKDEKLIY